MSGLAPTFLRLTWTVKPVGSYQPCNVCKNAHHKCDGKRPCGRCTRLQRVSDCLDPPSRKRGRPTIEVYEEGQDPQQAQPVRTVLPDEAVIPLQVNPVSLKISFDYERCTGVSEAWLLMMGYTSPEHVIGLHWIYLIPPSVVPLAVAEWYSLERSFVDAVKSTYVLEMKTVGLTKSGRILCVRALHTVRLGDDRRVTGSTIEVMDVHHIPTIALHPPNLWKVVVLMPLAENEQAGPDMPPSPHDLASSTDMPASASGHLRSVSPMEPALSTSVSMSPLPPYPAMHSRSPLAALPDNPHRDPLASFATPSSVPQRHQRHAPVKQEAPPTLPSAYHAGLDLSLGPTQPPAWTLLRTNNFDFPSASPVERSPYDSALCCADVKSPRSAPETPPWLRPSTPQSAEASTPTSNTPTMRPPAPYNPSES